MYFPYLRGRQFELVALRELLELELISDRIIPIVEPVKNTPSLSKTLKVYSDINRKILLIQNPKVGSYSRNNDLDGSGIYNNDYIINTYFLTSKNNDKIPNSIENSIILENPDDIDSYQEKFIDNFPYYTLIAPYKDLEREISTNRVLFANRFNNKDKNVEYTKEIDEFFSNDHLYYSSEGYIGFSDYSVIGDKYTEGGFAPYAVIIHIVYFDDKNRLRIRHFASDSNLDYNDTPKKLKEALVKLVGWNSSKKYKTYGIEELERIYNSGKYPGLGSIKKLSIMHHIELISKYLAGESYSDIL